MSFFFLLNPKTVQTIVGGVGGGDSYDRRLMDFWRKQVEESRRNRPPVQTVFKEPVDYKPVKVKLPQIERIVEVEPPRPKAPPIKVREVLDQKIEKPKVVPPVVIVKTEIPVRPFYERFNIDGFVVGKPNIFNFAEMPEVPEVLPKAQNIPGYLMDNATNNGDYFDKPLYELPAPKKKMNLKSILMRAEINGIGTEEAIVKALMN